MDVEEVISEHAVTLGILVNSVAKIEGFMEESVKGQMRQKGNHCIESIEKID